MNDAELIGQILNGNSNAFRFLVLKFEKLVAHMVFRIVQHHEETEDVCQEVFMKVYRELKSFRNESKLSTWIATIAVRESLTFIKKKKRSKLVNFDDIGVFENTHFHCNDPQKVYLDEENRRMVREMIDLLPVNYRTVLTLYHLDEFTYEEIGSITGMPEGTVKSYLFRARKIIHDKLQHLFDNNKALNLTEG